MAATDQAGSWWRDKRSELLELAAKTSPLYVYDAATILGSVAKLRSITAVHRAFFAIKANPNAEVLKLLYEAGCGFECVSPGELRHVFGLFPDLANLARTDVTASRVLFTPNFASRDEYEFGIAAGATMTLDSLYPLEHWGETFRDRDIMLRIDPPTSRKGHHEHVKTTGKESKFGISETELEKVPALVSAVNARVVGLHAHVGSGILSPETWPDTAKFMSTLLTKFPHVRVFDLGGGLGVPEREGQPGLDLGLVNEALTHFKKVCPDVQLWMEPGRFIIAQAGVLLCSVTQIKHKSEVNYIGVNTGFNSLIRPMLYNAYHPIYNLTRISDTSSIITADVVGNICESGDVFGHERDLPGSTVEGDIILIGTTGAYGHAMSSNYNLRDPAPEHLLV